MRRAAALSPERLSASWSEHDRRLVQMPMSDFAESEQSAIYSSSLWIFTPVWLHDSIVMHMLKVYDGFFESLKEKHSSGKSNVTFCTITLVTALIFLHAMAFLCGVSNDIHWDVGLFRDSIPDEGPYTKHSNPSRPPDGALAIRRQSIPAKSSR
ncbi:hypothetical protein QTP86_008335 [Hemibagrus guttatus]|nr:hypothetical protein QTP86_008335 [Hemibagrus guttatus]